MHCSLGVLGAAGNDISLYILQSIAIELFLSMQEVMEDPVLAEATSLTLLTSKGLI